jgi:hypothetical protein
VGLNAAENTVPPRPASEPRLAGAAGFEMFHIDTVPSVFALASVSASGLNDTSYTVPVDALSVVSRRG